MPGPFMGPFTGTPEEPLLVSVTLSVSPDPEITWGQITRSAGGGSPVGGGIDSSEQFPSGSGTWTLYIEEESYFGAYVRVEDEVDVLMDVTLSVTDCNVSPPTPVPEVCPVLRGSVTPTFFGITGMKATEILTSDWDTYFDGYSWPGLTPAGLVIDVTPDYIAYAVPKGGFYVYTRQLSDQTQIDLIGSGGVIYTWTSSVTMSYGLAIDASGDYWLQVAEDDGTGSADNSLWRVTPGGTATKVVAAIDAANGVSPQQIATTPDGAVWFSKYGTGSGLYRWYGGTATQVSGVGLVTVVPQADSSVWFHNGSGWRTISPSLVVSGSSPCPSFDSITAHSVAWTDDWSSIAIQDPSGDVYEIA